MSDMPILRLPTPFAPRTQALVVLVILLASCGLRPVHITVTDRLMDADEIIATTSAHSVDCGTTATGVWALAYDGEACPTMTDLDANLRSAAKVTHSDAAGLDGAVLILYPHQFMCGGQRAIGCTTWQRTMIADLSQNGWDVVRHEALHAMLFASGTDGDVGHLRCWQWHAIDSTRPDCFETPKIGAAGDPFDH